MTDVALAACQKLDLDVVCDLRREAECEREPSPYGLAKRRLHLPTKSVDTQPIYDRFAAGELARSEAEVFMDRYYRGLVQHQAQVYRTLFEQVLADQRVLFHCSAGKDRTGYGSALILLALGVPHKVVFEDYLLSGELLDLRDDLKAHIESQTGQHIPMNSLDSIMPLLETHPKYLQSSLDEMVQTAGSVDGYLEQALGIDQATRQHLVELLTEPV